jgi:hypothetical protein
MVLIGNTSGSVACEVFDSPAIIKSIRVSNRSVSTANVSLIVNDGQERYMKRMAIAASGSEVDDAETILPKGFQLIIVTDQSIDYYITLE